MRRNKLKLTALAFLLLAINSQTLAVTGPTTLNFPANGQFKLDISNDNPNLISVPGDRIVALNTTSGRLSDKKSTKEGAVIIATTVDKPFTLFIETEKGQAFSVNAIPRNGPGMSYRLMANMPINRQVAEKWEQSQPYENMLVTVGRSFIQGQLPTGYIEIPVANERLKAPSGLSATAVNNWAGGRLKVTKFQLTNTRSSSVALKEKDFWFPGTRAVLFEYKADSLASKGLINIFIIRDIEEIN